MAFVLTSNAKNRWLSQFEPPDQGAAERLVDSIRFVSDMELKQQLRQVLVELLSESGDFIAVFVEREQRRPGGKIQRLYKQSVKPPRTAYGAAARPVDPKLAYDPKVGSEGIIAQFLSQFCKENPRALFHPTVWKCKDKSVKRFVLVTDIIGSGSRTYDWLESAWRTATLRSWHSYHRLRFEVVAFTATEAGEEVVKNHRSNPKVRCCLACPTIKSTFQRREAEAIRDLCLRYDPAGPDPEESLGYRGGEVLLAFAHSIPNNVPRLLFKSGNGWSPLFHQQVTRDRFEEAKVDALIAERTLDKLRQKRLAAAVQNEAMRETTRKMLLFLGASASEPRTPAALSRKSGLLISEIKTLSTISTKAGWIDKRGLLTDAGHREMEHARRMVKGVEKVLLQGSDAPYYPQMLRAPSDPV